MDFRYTEEQLALRETLQRFIDRDYGFEQRRALTRSELGFSAPAWARYADLGLLALTVPEAYGGLGGSGIDVMVIMEQIGRGLLLEPYLSTAVLGTGILSAAGSEGQKQELLPRIAAGGVRVALAAYEAAARYDLEAVATRARREGESWRLDGHKSVVLDAPSADLLLVSARLGESAREGLGVFLVPSQTAGVRLRAYGTHSGGRAAELMLHEVRLPGEALVGAAGQGTEVLERGVDAAIAALCAEACGIVAALNEATLAYLKNRKQFGVPIGVFQALQHRMADMYIAGEQVRSMAIIAAAAAGETDAARRRRAISGAKAYIGRAARFVGQQAVQLHGAMGVVDDLIVSHYFKRLTMIDMTFGDADFHQARFAACAGVPAD